MSQELIGYTSLINNQLEATMIDYTVLGISQETSDLWNSLHDEHVRLWLGYISPSYETDNEHN